LLLLGRGPIRLEPGLGLGSKSGAKAHAVQTLTRLREPRSEKRRAPGEVTVNARAGIRAQGAFTALDPQRFCGKNSRHMKTMTRVILCSILFAAIPLSMSAADPNDAKWVSLFNGKDLKGWAPVNDVTFEVKDGNLRLVKGMGWLRTEKQYKDFIFECEWRALEPQYDSGLFLRAGLEGKPWPKDGWQVNLSAGALGALVKGYKTMVPSETPRKPVNQWVKVRIEVKGKKAKLIVDGEDAWTSDLIDAERGYLGIQAENKSFDFRNIRVQEL
jgi:hypothetical protein